jgi:hypothetical protein
MGDEPWDSSGLGDGTSTRACRCSGADISISNHKRWNAILTEVNRLDSKGLIPNSTRSLTVGEWLLLNALRRASMVLQSVAKLKRPR